ncbi:MAG: c-type cytochrome [Hyphomicrobiales bacterium]
MKHGLKWIVGSAFLSVSLLSGVAFADGHFEKAIKARKAVMTIYAFNLGVLGAMAKGEAEYDSKVAMGAANNLLAAANLDASQLWPQGSDNKAMPDKTRALPDIWTTYPKVVEHQKALIKALEALGPASGKDLQSLQGAMKAVGGGCGGCHKPFRAEKKS